MDQADKASMDATVKKEIKKINYYRTLVTQYMGQRDYPKLMRLMDITPPGKVKLMEDLIEKMADKMIDKQDTIDEVETWSNATRNAIDDTVCKGEEGWNFIQSYHKQKADEAQIQSLEKEKREEE